MFRSYGGDWRRLSDLVRASLVFHKVHDLAACLRAIAEDEEVRIVPAGNGKMRLRTDFDAATTGGYRDVQLTVTLRSEEALRRGVAEHRAEVQLHLAPIHALKSEGGHRLYVLSRNMSGR